jgi:DNA-binding MarR family transcriptional regulator
MIEPFDDLMPLTEKQKAVLSAIHNYWAKRKYYPTQRELAEQFDVSLAAIQNTIAQLRKKDYLVRVEDRGRRNMRLTHKAGIILGVSGELNTD